jgi:hypothetical protein
MRPSSKKAPGEQPPVSRRSTATRGASSFTKHGHNVGVTNVLQRTQLLEHLVPVLFARRVGALDRDQGVGGDVQRLQP